jgi:hypothetical protein
MDIMGSKLIRILVAVNFIGSFSPILFALAEHGSSGDHYSYRPSCSAQVKELKEEGVAAKKIEAARESCVNKLLSENNVCSDIEEEFSDVKKDLREACKGTGYESNQIACIDAARNCGGQSGANLGSAFMPGGGLGGNNMCSTKDQMSQQKESQDKQQEDLSDRQSEVTDRYYEAMGDLQDSMAGQYEILADMAQINKEKQQTAIDTENQVALKDLEHRQQVIGALQEYQKSQTQIAKARRDLVALNAALGDLPTEYNNILTGPAADCQHALKAQKFAHQQALDALKSEFSKGLQETTGNSTINSYHQQVESYKRKYDQQKKMGSEQLKMDYNKCIANVQKSYKAAVLSLKGEIDDRQDSINDMEADLDAMKRNLPVSLGVNRTERQTALATAQNNMQFYDTQKSLKSMSFNQQVNMAQQRMQMAEQEMAQFKAQSESMARMNMMSGFLGLLTGAGRGGLGDVAVLVSDYDKYQQKLDEAHCGPTSSGGSTLARSGGR